MHILISHFSHVFSIISLSDYRQWLCQSFSSRTTNIVRKIDNFSHVFSNFGKQASTHPFFLISTTCSKWFCPRTWIPPIFFARSERYNSVITRKFKESARSGTHLWKLLAMKITHHHILHKILSEYPPLRAGALARIREKSLLPVVMRILWATPRETCPVEYVCSIRR